MDDLLTGYIYEPSLIITIGVPLILLLSLRNPKTFIWILINLVFLRLNERLPIPYSIPILAHILLCILLFVNYSDFKGVIRDRESRLLVYIIGLILFGTVLFRREDFSSNIITCLTGLIYYFAIRGFLYGRSGLVVLSSALMTCCSIICFEPVYYFLTEPSNSTILKHFIGNTGRLKAWGIWGNANETAIIACMGMGSLWLLLNLTKSLKLKLACIPLGLLFSYTVLETLSRAGLVSFCLIFTVYVLMSKHTVYKVAFLLLIILGIVMLSSIYEQRTDADKSTNERYDLRYEGVQVFKNHPVLGIGFNHASDDTGGMVIHCTYIQAFAELGAIGGLMLVSLIYTLVKKTLVDMMRYKHISGDVEGKKLLYIISGIFASWLFYMYFGNQLLSVLFFTMFAFISNCLNYCDTLTHEKVVICYD